MGSMAEGAAARKVIIIGAGFAGLAAARRVAFRGAGRWQATILEGSHRVGGRAHTAELPGFGSVEMGATWLHGLQGNPLYHYAVDKGIMSPHATQKAGEWGNVSWAREGEVQPLAGRQLEVAKAAAGSYSMAIEDSLSAEDPDATVGQHLRQVWPKACEGFGPDEQQLAAESWGWREKLQRSMDGCHTTGHMAAQGLAAYDELDGLNCPVPGGFQGLAVSMADEGLDIQFGSVVERIELGDGAQARITCRDGTTHVADAVIITVSLGVLKATHETLFSPPLPPHKVAAVARMGMGTINKVFVSSNSQPNTGSPRQPGAYNLLWSAASPTAADSFLGPQESSTQRSGDASPSSTNDVQPARQGAGVSMIDWRKGAYAIRFQGSEFVTSKALAHCGAADGGVKVGSRYSGSAGVADVDAQLEPVQPAASGAAAPAADSGDQQGVGSEAGQREQRQLVATMWIAGAEARAMEDRDEAEVRGDIDGLLDTFPPVRQRLPAITAVHRSDWGSNPLTQGSYSYPAAGSGLTDIGILAEPVCHEGRPVLLFAGEATHPSHYGTASGAFLTGEREVDRLLAV